MAVAPAPFNTNSHACVLTCGQNYMQATEDAKDRLLQDLAPPTERERQEAARAPPQDSKHLLLERRLGVCRVVCALWLVVVGCWLLAVGDKVRLSFTILEDFET